ncbi:MAG TPA: hypothetical protein VMG34_10935 [Bacteroidota bacterium]|nr:hypothetical protein [Bacteroidota bacterium]
MKITSDVINDLLPLYSSGECSSDTKALVEEYLTANPGVSLPSPADKRLINATLPGRMEAGDELRVLLATRRRLRVRSSVMALAIFFTVAPFSFAYVHGQFYSLISESPTAAAVYGAIGLLFWGIYFGIKRRAGNI